MYDFIKGTVVSTAKEYMVLENSGIGYRINTSANTMSKIISGDANVKIYTHLHVREDAMMLYGFTDCEELSIFEMLIGISGIGPKVALGVLSTFTPQAVAIAIASDNSAELSKAKGIGRKTAMRIILELKDKFKAIEKEEMLSESEQGTNQITEETKTALMVLGFKAADASLTANENYEDGMTVEGLIMKCLKKMSS
ncbi:MAG: Holliday junction branch migration protein RuvA [Clostridia bacterium]|nr:Holliday junction branch migration protein RuvA [Clostridia bacterium]MBN2884070.1 Holliday junction branch migration protein RuvA [Clostridia bacterium]